MDNLEELLCEKRILESKLYVLNDLIYNTCVHKWEKDYIENPHTEEITKIIYCNNCEMQQRR